MVDTAPLVTLHVLVELALIARVLLRPNRQPASRIAWVAVIAGLPLLGIVAYVLFGEVRIGRRRGARLRGALERMPSRPRTRPARGRCPRALRAPFQAGTFDQRLRPGGRKLGQAAGRLERRDRRHGRRHRRRRGACASAFLHLADGRQRRQDGRRAEAGRGPRRPVPRHGGRPRLALDAPVGALGGDARSGRRTRGRAADRQSAAARHRRAASTCATTARSW